MIRIESESNKIIKLTSSLKQKKYRQSTGLFIAEGERIVSDGAKRTKPEFIIISDKYKLKSEFDCEIYSVPERIFLKLSDTKNPQGILGVFKIIKRNIEDISLEKTLILNRISDPGNLGTLLRTASAVGFSNIIMDKECVDLYNPKVVRSTMSSIFDLSIYITMDLPKQVINLKEKGFNIYSTVLNEKSINLFKAKLESPLAIIIGNEANGIDKEITEISSMCLKIPMVGQIESLNAAVSGSIVLYEILRRELYEQK